MFVASQVPDANCALPIIPPSHSNCSAPKANFPSVPPRIRLLRMQRTEIGKCVPEPRKHLCPARKRAHATEATASATSTSPFFDFHKKETLMFPDYVCASQMGSNVEKSKRSGQTLMYHNKKVTFYSFQRDAWPTVKFNM